MDTDYRDENIFDEVNPADVSDKCQVLETFASSPKPTNSPFNNRECEILPRMTLFLTTSLHNAMR